MPDYRELYLTLFRASNEAIELLISAQQKCEELYCSESVPELRVLDFKKADHPD